MNIMTPRRRDEIRALLVTEQKAPYSEYLRYFQVALLKTVPELMDSHALLVEQLSDRISDLEHEYSQRRAAEKELEDLQEREAGHADELAALETDRDEWKTLSESCDAAWSTKLKELVDLRTEVVELRNAQAAAESVIVDQCYAIEAYKSERLSAAGLERDLYEAYKRENSMRTAAAAEIKSLEYQLNEALGRAEDNETRAASEEQHALDNWNSFVDMRERAERTERLLDSERRSYI